MISRRTSLVSSTITLSQVGQLIWRFELSQLTVRASVQPQCQQRTSISLPSITCCKSDITFLSQNLPCSQCRFEQKRLNAPTLKRNIPKIQRFFERLRSLYIE